MGTRWNGVFCYTRAKTGQFAFPTCALPLLSVQRHHCVHLRSTSTSNPSAALQITSTTTSIARKSSPPCQPARGEDSYTEAVGKVCACHWSAQRARGLVACPRCVLQHQSLPSPCKYPTAPLGNCKYLTRTDQNTFLHQKQTMKLHRTTYKRGKIQQSGLGKTAFEIGNYFNYTS